MARGKGPGRRGPAKKPTSRKILEGSAAWHRRHGKLNEDEPEPSVSIPTPPPEVVANERARDEWERIAPLLELHGLIAQEYRGPLAAMCLSWARYMEAEAAVTEHGAFLLDEDGKPIRRNPAAMASDAERKEYRQWVVHFGLSPAAVASVKGRPREKPAEFKPRSRA